MEMRRLILISLALVWCLGENHRVQGFTYEDKEVETEEAKMAMFERWRSHHKMESISPEEKTKQFKAFKANLELVHTTNKANKPYKLQLNKFAGMHLEELKLKHTGYLKSASAPKLKGCGDGLPPFRYRNATNLPAAIDWRALGAVTRVKDQGQCGSCFAFSAVDAVESMHFLRSKELIELSPKEIVDCGNLGACGGGRMRPTFEYIEKNGGLTTERNYPYVPQRDPCNLKKEHDIAVQVGGHENVPWGDLDLLLKAAAHQPLSVAVFVGEPFFLYKSGVMTAPCDGEPNHAVSLVGYGVEPDGTKYWLIKNSWAEVWGEKGYMKLVRDTDAGPGGYCGIATDASYPTPDKTCTPHDESGPIVHTSTEL